MMSTSAWAGFLFVFSLFLLVRFRAPLRPPSSLDWAFTFHLSTTRFRKGTFFYGGHLAAILLGLWRACLGIQSGSAAGTVKIMLQFIVYAAADGKRSTFLLLYELARMVSRFVLSALCSHLRPKLPPKNTKKRIRNSFDTCCINVMVTYHDVPFRDSVSILSCPQSQNALICWHFCEIFRYCSRCSMTHGCLPDTSD